MITVMFQCVGKTSKLDDHHIVSWTITFERGDLILKVKTCDRLVANKFIEDKMYPINIKEDHELGGLFTPDGKPIDRETGEVKDPADRGPGEANYGDVSVKVTGPILGVPAQAMADEPAASDASDEQETFEQQVARITRVIFDASREYVSLPPASLDEIAFDVADRIDSQGDHPRTTPLQFDALVEQVTPMIKTAMEAMAVGAEAVKVALIQPFVPKVTQKVLGALEKHLREHPELIDPQESLEPDSDRFRLIAPDGTSIVIAGDDRGFLIQMHLDELHIERVGSTMVAGKVTKTIKAIIGKPALTLVDREDLIDREDQEARNGQK